MKKLRAGKNGESLLKMLPNEASAESAPVLSRRHVHTLLWGYGAWLWLPGEARSMDLAGLSDTQATQSLKTVLEKGSTIAIQTLAQPGGFMGNPLVHIPLPRVLEQAAQLLRGFGQGGRLDELIASMNQAAEASMPMAQGLLTNAVKSMSVKDAKTILMGGDTAVTDYFSEKTRQPLTSQFLPVVTRTTAKVGLSAKYNQIAGKAASMGLLENDQASIEQYVTDKAIHGLYLMIGEEEKKIRKDPVGTGSELLKKVFGGLK